MKYLPMLFLLCGCSMLPLEPCVAADVATTVIGVHSGLLREVNPLWKSSVNAGHFMPFVLASVLMVWFVEQLRNDMATQTVATVECGLAAHNLWIMR